MPRDGKSRAQALMLLVLVDHGCTLTDSGDDSIVAKWPDGEGALLVVCGSREGRWNLRQLMSKLRDTFPGTIAPECSICRSRHGSEIIHPCE